MFSTFEFGATQANQGFQDFFDTVRQPSGKGTKVKFHCD